MVGRVGLEPTTKGFKFAWVSPLLGLCHHPQPNCWGAGRSGDAYRMGSSRPSLCTFPPTGLSTCLRRAWLKIALACALGFLEFTRFSDGNYFPWSPFRWVLCS